MFSGIIEQTVKCLKCVESEELIRINLQRPSDFNDIKIGDSICVNGVCLTIESFTKDEMVFALAPETLKVTSWRKSYFLSKKLNIERSLRFGDRIHGHLVSGHVDAMGIILACDYLGESLVLKVQIPESLKAFVWKKGSLCINGVSLTVNDAQENWAEFCLIPETLKRTNLSEYKISESLCLEADYLAKSLLRARECGYEFN